jgi:phosphate transport system substrate-binding protein
MHFALLGGKAVRVVQEVLEHRVKGFSLHPRSIYGVIACVLLVGLATSSCSHGTSGNETRGALTAVGSPVQSDAIAAWSNAWRKVNTATSLNYSPDGSGVGITALATGQAYFAAIDSPISPADQALTQARCGPVGAFSVPVSVTPLAVAFNLPSVTGLKLSPAVLAGIFSGEISRWDDDAIVAINPTTRLPSADIVPIMATESSALTLAATKYLKTSERWLRGESPVWHTPKNGVEVKKYRDLSSKVNETAGAIAVMDVASIGNRFDTALLSFGGDFVRASKDSIALAAREGLTTEKATGVEFTLPAKSDRGYPLGLVNYQAFCSTYVSQQLTTLVKSWALFVLGADGQIASNYFGSVGSPGEETLRKSAQRIKKIEASG